MFDRVVGDSDAIETLDREDYSSRDSMLDDAYDLMGRADASERDRRAHARLERALDAAERYADNARRAMGYSTEDVNRMWRSGSYGAYDRQEATPVSRRGYMGLING